MIRDSKVTKLEEVNDLAPATGNTTARPKLRDESSWSRTYRVCIHLLRHTSGTTDALEIDAAQT